MSGGARARGPELLSPAQADRAGIPAEFIRGERILGQVVTSILDPELLFPEDAFPR